MKISSKTILQITAAVMIALLIIGLLRNNSKQSNHINSVKFFTMDTEAKIIAVADDEKTCQKALAAAAGQIRHLEKLMNRYDRNSQISLINKQAFDRAVPVDPNLFYAIEKSIYYSKYTDGAFDITVGPLIDLFKECAEANSLPEKERLTEVKAKIGSEKIILNKDNFSVRFAAKGMEIDLGAIAKGFAIDLATEKMKKCGAVGGLVDIGGDIGCFGVTQKGKKWVIGIQNPADTGSGKTIAKLKITDAAVATSGDYQRFYVIDGKKFSHIFDPAAEKSADQLSSVTIIAADATAADALATAVSVLGAKKGLKLIENTPNTEVITIESPGGRKILSKTAAAYIDRK